MPTPSTLPVKLNARLRLQALHQLRAFPENFVLLSDMLTDALGNPLRKPGRYTWYVTLDRRDFDIVVQDKGPKMRISMEKDGKPMKHSTSVVEVTEAAVGLRAVQEAIGDYVRHEQLDAKAGKDLINRLAPARPGPKVIRR